MDSTTFKALVVVLVVAVISAYLVTPAVTKVVGAIW